MLILFHFIIKLKLFMDGYLLLFLELGCNLPYCVKLRDHIERHTGNIFILQIQFTNEKKKAKG